MIKKIGRKNAVVVGVLVMAAATLLFGLAGFCKNVYFYMTFSLIARVVQGVGDVLVCVTVPSIIAIEFPKNCEFYMGLQCSALAVGRGLGPIMASVVYRFLNYQ